MATISLLGAIALKTTPYEPSPIVLTILYFYIKLNYYNCTLHPPSQSSPSSTPNNFVEGGLFKQIFGDIYN